MQLGGAPVSELSGVLLRFGRREKESGVRSEE